MAKKAVKKSARKPRVVVVSRPRGPKVPRRTSGGAVIPVTGDDPVVALAEEKRLRVEAEERNEEAFAWVNNAIDILHNAANNLRKAEA